MKKTINKDHCSFYRFLLQKNLAFKQTENKIYIRDGIVVVILEHQLPTFLSVIYAHNYHYYGIIIAQKTYRKVISMRKFV